MTQTLTPPEASPWFLNADDFDLFLAQFGQSVSWLKSHACPCVWSASGSTFGRLALAGSPQPQCQTCAGAGVYWDAPSQLFIAGISFRHLAFSSDEPGMRMDNMFGFTSHAEPAFTIPYHNPRMSAGDPRQPTAAWRSFSLNDIVVMPDMLTRYNAVLQAGGQQNLPFQQNLTVSSVTIWNPETQKVQPITAFTVDGPTITVPDLPAGTFYIVEFDAAALYVAFRRAGALPHSRPFAQGTINLPKAFRLQALDFWTRERGIQQQISVGGQMLAFNIGLPVT